jgi:hypothetical protein
VTNATPYQEIEDILSVVRRFERCEYAKAEFTHRLHLTVAAWYLWTSSPADALNRMRSCLLRFTKHHNVNGYHETITRFWMLLAAAHIAKGDSRHFVDQVNALLERFPDKNFLFAHYTRDLLMSDAARRAWVEPDLQAIDSNEPTTCE